MNHIRTCIFKPYRNGGPTFKLIVSDTGRTDWRGVSVLAYELRSGGKVLFSGSDFAGSPGHAIDSDETMEGLMGFLTLRPGDTDREYFADYTREQLRFCDNHAEALAMEVERRFGK